MKNKKEKIIVEGFSNKESRAADIKDAETFLNARIYPKDPWYKVVRYNIYEFFTNKTTWNTRLSLFIIVILCLKIWVL